MVKVGVSVHLCATPPALGERMLTVHATHGARTAIVTCGIAIHVPHTSSVIGVAVGTLEVIPQASIGDDGVLLQQSMHGVFQVLPSLAITVAPAVIEARASVNVIIRCFM